MINGFPVEIITEILLYLPLYDLIQLLKSNRRTFNIARHEHSIMKHRLSNRRYTHVKVVGCSSEKFLEMIKKQQQNHPELARNKPHNYTINNDVSIEVKEYDPDEKYPIEYSLVFNSSFFESYTLQRCEAPKRTVYDEYIEPKVYFKSSSSCPKSRVMIFKSFDEMMEAVMKYLAYIAEIYSVVKKFSLLGYDDQMWQKLKEFFEHHEMSRNEVSVNINLVKHTSYEVCCSKLFENGIDKITISQEKNVVAGFIQLHPRVNEANCVEILNPQRSIGDEQFATMECRELKMVNQNITTHGLALLIKNIYDDAVCGPRNYQVRMNKFLKSKHLFPFIPKEAYKKVKSGVLELTNKYNQKFHVYKNDNGVWFKLVSVDD